MTLTKENLDDLKRPFAAKHHEFHRGNVYLQERPICERIEQVDPGWESRHISTRIESNQVTVVLAMTICGVTRTNAGTSNITMIDPDKEYQGKKVNADKTAMQLTIPVNEAEKAAFTDALKRCARLFGVGRYLLACPKDIKNQDALQRFLDTMTASPSPAPDSGTNSDSAPQPTGAAANGGNAAAETKVTQIVKATKAARKGGTMIKMETVGGRLCTMFSAQLLRDAGYVEEDELKYEDDVVFWAEAERPTVTIVIDGKFLNVTAVQPLIDAHFGERETAPMPGMPHDDLDPEQGHDIYELGM